jgi:glycosyltransferase involved in cell wall biosynthesis
LQAPPTISIVTACFQHGRFIERTLRSVLDQRYPALEYFVHDGRSNDGTVAILERYAARLSGWTSQRDRGQTHALNTGFERTRGDILAYLNADDLLLPGALHYVGAFFQSHPEVDVVYGHRLVIDELDREIGRWILPPHADAIMAWADFVPQETLFWRRSVWQRVEAHLDEEFHFAMDWDLLLRFREAGARFMRLPRFLGAFRVHAEQKTSTLLADQGAVEMDRLRARCHGRPVTRREIYRATVPYLTRHLVWHAGTQIRQSWTARVPFTVAGAAAPS